VFHVETTLPAVQDRRLISDQPSAFCSSMAGSDPLAVPPADLDVIMPTQPERDSVVGHRRHQAGAVRGAEKIIRTSWWPGSIQPG